MNPAYAEAFFRLGVLSHQRGDDEAARKNYEKAVELSGGTPKYRNNLAYLYLKSGRLEHYAVNDRYPLSALEMARILWRQGRLTEAFDHTARGSTSRSIRLPASRKAIFRS